jgi:hypothetical protein
MFEVGCAPVPEGGTAGYGRFFEGRLAGEVWFSLPNPKAVDETVDMFRIALRFHRLGPQPRDGEKAPSFLVEGVGAKKI